MKNKKQNIATLRLFNSIIVGELGYHAGMNKEMLTRCLSNGFMVDPTVELENDITSFLINEIGINPAELNSAFHKSWSVVRDTDEFMLYIQQIIHYFTTYGYEALGVYDKDSVFIPKEKLDIPEIGDGLNLRVVHGITKEDLVDRILALVSSDVALSSDAVNDLMVLIDFTGSYKRVLAVNNNRELSGLIYSKYNIVPKEPTAFLRYLVAKTTGETLLIKNKVLIGEIEQSDTRVVDEIIADDPDDLGSIFYRYKPLFLAYKKVSSNKNFFNRLRKSAAKLHKPIPTDLYSSVVADITKGILNFDVFKSELYRLNIYRKVRLINAISFYMSMPKEAAYRIRNGRIWILDLDVNLNRSGLIKAYNILFDSIVEHIKENVVNKVFYVPEKVNYVFPVSQKKYVGFVPSGSFIETNEKLLVGVHWYDKNGGRRIDLDLSSMSLQGKIGWDARYKGDNIYFSGDMTAAPYPNGASEYLLFDDISENYLIWLNFFNSSVADNVDFTFILGEHGSIDENHVIDPNKTFLMQSDKIDERQKVLGYVSKVVGGLRFYFYDGNLGAMRSSVNNELSGSLIDYFNNVFQANLLLSDVIKAAGGVVLNYRPEETEYTDLSLNALSVDTFLNIVE